MFQNSLKFMSQKIQSGDKPKKEQVQKLQAQILEEKAQIEKLNEQLDSIEGTIKSKQSQVKNDLRLELSDLNEIKSQETQRCLSLKRKRGELVVKVEQLKRRVLSQRSLMLVKSKERASTQEKINRIQEQKNYLVKENQTISKQLENQSLIIANLDEEVREFRVQDKKKEELKRLLEQ